MVELWFPYGLSEVPVRVPDENLVDILQPKPSDLPVSTINIDELISEEAITAAKTAERICLIVGRCQIKNLISDTTKSLISILTKSGIASSKITILVTPQSDKLEDLDDLTITKHSPTESPLRELEGFSGGFSPAINEIAVQSKLNITIGELAPHHVIGYTGLSDLIFPGLSSVKNANEELVRSNPMDPHELGKERLAIGSLLSNTYALGIVLKPDMSIAKAAFGHFNHTLNELSHIINQVRTVEASKEAEIVVLSSGGSPFDESLLRSIEVFPAGLSILKKNGALIVAAECSLGHGGTEFYQWSSEHKEARHLEARLRHRFNYCGWKAAYLSRALTSHRIYLVSALPDFYVERTFGMRSAKTMNAALESAQRALGADSSITVIPNASQIIPRLLHPVGESQPGDQTRTSGTGT